MTEINLSGGEDEITVGDTVYYNGTVAQVVGIREYGKPYLIRLRHTTIYVDRDEITKP